MDTEGNELRTAMHARLQKVVRELVNAFQEVLAAARLETNKLDDASANLRVQVEAANVAHACEELLRFIADLKVLYIVQDLDGMNEETKQFRGMVETQCHETDDALFELQRTVLAALAEAEHAYEGVV
ncbi:Mediator of RNA polymerase II transcription subunit 22 [Porphyridium purpureum]|uniref:Mediator of RNA polymerase II transcription subunit 22 n=1 Tax=Porphyridium purpureum TaxID=35688 RepID=A0A5J4ZBE8_PORPP|nr:Mediator of RNA polymerase II transcription subunit 22 [Porphyridium purpureum]|eukprot:POR4419..scf295_1